MTSLMHPPATLAPGARRVSEEDIHRRYRREWLTAAVGFVVALGIGAGGARMWVHERVLDQRAVATEAEVINAFGTFRSLPDTAVVRYSVAGATIEARLTVSSSHRYGSGDRLIIEYDPQHPRHARPLEGWEPTYKVVLFLSAGLLILVPAGVVTSRRQIRRSAAAVNSGRDQPAHAVLYTRFRWWSWPSGATDHLAGLWPEGAPRHGPPPYSVVLASRLDHRRVHDGPVRVLGGLDPGSHVVLQFGSRLVETTGVIRRGLPRRAKPVEAELGKRRWPLRLHPRDPRGRH